MSLAHGKRMRLILRCHGMQAHAETEQVEGVANIQVDKSCLLFMQSTRRRTSPTSSSTATRTWRPASPVAWPALQPAWPLASLVTPASGVLCATALPLCNTQIRPARRETVMHRMVHGWKQCNGQDLKLCCALCCCRANAQQPKLFVGMILILIFAEALALYGLIGAAFVTLMTQVSGHVVHIV